jgi:hypothetical protein
MTGSSSRCCPVSAAVPHWTLMPVGTGSWLCIWADDAPGQPAPFHAVGDGTRRAADARLADQGAAYGLTVLVGVDEPGGAGRCSSRRRGSGGQLCHLEKAVLVAERPRLDGCVLGFGRGQAGTGVADRRRCSAPGGGQH